MFRVNGNYLIIKRGDGGNEVHRIDDLPNIEIDLESSRTSEHFSDIEDEFDRVANIIKYILSNDYRRND